MHNAEIQINSQKNGKLPKSEHLVLFIWYYLCVETGICASLSHPSLSLPLSLSLSLSPLSPNLSFAFCFNCNCFLVLPFFLFLSSPLSSGTETAGHTHASQGVFWSSRGAFLSRGRCRGTAHTMTDGWTYGQTENYTDVLYRQTDRQETETNRKRLLPRRESRGERPGNEGGGGGECEILGQGRAAGVLLTRV